MQRGETALHQAPHCPSLPITIAHSLAMQMSDTALHLACRGKRLEVAKWLVEQMSREAALALNQVRDS